jgi:hypothetical protein
VAIEFMSCDGSRTSRTPDIGRRAAVRETCPGAEVAAIARSARGPTSTRYRPDIGGAHLTT